MADSDFITEAQVAALIPIVKADVTAARGAAENAAFLAAGAVQSVVAGDNVTVDDTDPANPIISASGGGGSGGAVDSVNGQTGEVVLDAEDVGAAATSHTHSAGQVTGLATVATSGSYDDLDDTPTLGTAAAADAGDFAATSHSHAAGAITSGTLAIGRIPTGTSSSTVALGDHSHTPSSIGAVAGLNGVTGLWQGTETEYDAIAVPDANVVYVVLPDA